MKQFPFAHTLQMTYRLEDGVLEVRTQIENLSIEPMPVAIGFHPYFQLTDSTREDWMLSIGAKTHWLLADNKIPTGETEPADKFFPNRKAVPLKDFDLDHVFGDLERDAQGRAVMSVKGKTQQLDVMLGAELPLHRALFAEPRERARRWRRTRRRTWRRTGAGARGAARRRRPCRSPARKTPSPIAASSPSNRWSGSPIR